MHLLPLVSPDVLQTEVPALPEPTLPLAGEPLAQVAEVLAHRLRGPVSCIQGYAELLGATLPHGEQRDLVFRIFEGAARIEHMLHDLQHFSLPVVALPQPLGLADELERAIHALPTEAAARVHLDTATVPTVFADPVLLRQAVLVLVQNALEAEGPDGDVELAATTTHATTGHATTVLSVWNATPMTGPSLDRAFQPFFTTKAQNLGVGLPLARRIAEAHGGTLVRAPSAHGTRFDLHLPVPSAAAR